MRAMSDTVSTIFGAIAAGAFALAVAYISYRAGRRQTADQATVEHGQWLRGQRQQAYLAFQDTWDTAVEDLEALQESWEGRVHAYEAEGEQEDPEAVADRLCKDTWRAVRKDLERVEYLGPQRIDDCMRDLRGAFRAMVDVIGGQTQAGASRPHWDEWYPVLARAQATRFQFQVAAMETLRQPPSPGRSV
jgi:cbb3-type cytochrome oxidase subunit 3